MRYASWTLAAVLGLALGPGPASAPESLRFEKQWTHPHATPGQVSEIPAFDPRTRTIWVAGVVGVDVLDAATGTLLEHLDVTDYGSVNSVAIRNGLAALAVEAAPDRRRPGVVLFYDTRTRTLAPGVNAVGVGPLPDMLTFTHDGTALLVANEGTPNAVADTPYEGPDPEGSVSIIDVATRSLVATARLAGVPHYGVDVRTSAGMNFEPEYIAVEASGARAFVTLQEGNAVGVLDLDLKVFTAIVGLGAKSFGLKGNEIDALDTDGEVSFVPVVARGLYMPDAIAAYTYRGQTYLVTANEGEFREDNLDRATASSEVAAAPLTRLRVLRTESASGTVVAAGGRSFSIWSDTGALVYDSGNGLELEARRRGIYDDARSPEKGVEPEGVALLKVGGRTFAFIGLERTREAAVGVFDVTSPSDVTFVDMIVTPGDRSPEGLAVFADGGAYFLAVANEAVGTGAVSTHTTVYRIVPVQ